MSLYAFGHISWETFKAYRVMLKGEGFGFMRRLKAWRFFTGFAASLFKASLPVFSRSYHPREHPICNDSQNHIAVAWRAYHAAGHDTQSLDQADMQTIMEMSHAH